MYKILLLIIFAHANFFFVSFAAFAATQNISTKYGTVSVTPVISFDNAQKLNPTPHVKLRTLYGLRATWQFQILAVEGEYKIGNDSEYFASSNQTIREDVKKYTLGLKASFNLNSLLTWSLRGGAQIKQSKMTTTINSNTTVTNGASYLDPYIGTELSIHLINLFSLNAGLDAVYSDFPNKGKIELDSSFGISFHY